MTDHEDVIRRLRDERPQISELELDSIKQRVRRHASTPRKGQFMRSRLAILLTLVLGLMLSTTGAGLALQGQGPSNDAAMSQYNSGGVGGEEDDNPDTPNTPNTPDDGVLGEEDENNPGGGGTAPEQESRQVEAGSDGGELPFTGFAAIPILLVGIALLGTGLVLRRQQSDGDEA
jgi:hypothetical protein